ncbi:hypothetical protein [Rubrivivax gelatinosus]|uniref:Uncharacterized protein n=1 Tax=Rubrivivax gelatinosus TaxID=28068 RepID=A0A4R2MCU3_RUBGE|nr:hypothetical protein [Rubrivivax gelatinosus]TCP04390.1 hypothetical protein EV684_102143 [Rubrivivax gelatinosus]
MATDRYQCWRRAGVALLLVAMPAFGGDAGLVIEDLDGELPRLLVHAGRAGTGLAV